LPLDKLRDSGIEVHRAPQVASHPNL
jgi:hypothetical protein